MIRLFVVLMAWLLVASPAAATSHTVTLPVDCRGVKLKGCASAVLQALETAFGATLAARSRSGQVHGFIDTHATTSGYVVTVTFYDRAESANASHETTFAVLPSIPSAAAVRGVLQGVPLP